MAAAQTDMFKKTGAGTVTTLAAPGKALSATSITVGATTNHPTDTGIVIAIRQVDSAGELVAGTYTEWSATVTSGTTFGINAVPVYGSDQVYAAGSTTQVYIPLSSYAHNKLIDGILEHANQDGSLITAAVQAALNIPTTPTADWSALATAPTTITYNGNRSYDVLIPGVDYTDRLSNGMRLKLTRTTAPPTQCTDLEASSSQYWSKTSPAGTTFTDDFCVGAWINLESYTGASQVIISRYNGTSGWLLYINSSGQVLLQGNNASGSNYSRVVSYQSIPLNKWVHVAAQLDMSAFTSTTTTSYIMIDGVGVPASVERAGTNPTALVQAGNLEVGSYGSGTAAFDGKIAQAWYSSAKITQANIVTFISQGMTGSETSIVSHFDFNGDGNDNNANANNLTAQASAGFTTDSPFNSTEYGIITANSFSTDTTLTVQVPEGYAIPTSGGVSAVAYSTQQTPYGFPADKGKWEIIMLGKTTASTSSTSLATLNRRLTIPIGSWSLCLFSVEMLLSIGVATGRLGKVTLSSDATTETDPETTVSLSTNVTTSGNLSQSIMSEKAVLLTSATSYTLMGLVGNASNAVSLGTNNSVELHYIKARFTYV